MLRHILFGLIATSMTALSASAASIYAEVGVGFSQFRGSDPLFNAGLSGVSGLGTAFNGGVFFSLSNGPLEFQIGVQDRFNLGKDTAVAYATQIPYPVLRLQMSLIYLSFGYTPFVWKRISDSGGIDNFSRAEDTKSIFGEFGVLWAISPKFSLAGSGTTEWINSPTGMGPKPVIDFTIQMRVYFAFFGGGGSSERTSNEYNGWRYPFGHEKYYSR